MPTKKDRETGQELAYPEAVLLTKPVNQEFRGEVLCGTYLYASSYMAMFVWSKEIMVFVLGSGG